MENNDIRLYSRINRYISKDLYMQLYKLIYAEIDNNDKVKMVQIYLNEAGLEYQSLGPGTNRYAILMDQVVFKFALDKDGMIDNRREFLYSQDLQPYVIKVYECIPNGLIMVCERIAVFDMLEFKKPATQAEVKDILKNIVGMGYLVGDVGITPKNYTNWGRRLTGEVCCLDFAYIYNVRFGVFRCNCKDRSFFEYDANTFTKLKCPSCGKEYTFGEIRRKISKKDQEEEIGDIRRLGYNLDKPEAIMPRNEEFSPNKNEVVEKFIDGEEMTEAEKNIQEAIEYQKKKKEESQDWDYPPSLLDRYRNYENNF